MNNLNKFLRITETLISDIESINISFNCKLIIDGYGHLDLNKPISLSKFNEIHSLAHASAFGARHERRFDQTVRKSAEIKHPAVRFEGPCRIMLYDEDRVVRLYKMVLYKTGDFFDWHLDTPEEFLISTLMVNFGEYEGGELSFKDREGKEFVPYTKNAQGYNACMFPIDLPHRANELTGGYKVSLLFKVYEIQPEMTFRMSRHPLRKSPAETGPTIEEMMKKVIVEDDDVIWCSNREMVMKFMKVHPDCHSTQVNAASKPRKGTSVYLPQHYKRIIDDEDDCPRLEERPEISIALKKYEYKTITKCIVDQLQTEIDYYRYCYGLRGNSPVPVCKKVRRYNGFVIQPRRRAASENDPPLAAPQPSGQKRGKKSVRGKVAKRKQLVLKNIKNNKN